MHLFIFITHVQRTLRILFKLIGQSKAATFASGEITEARHGSAEAFFPSLSPSKLLYVADKHNKCNYLIDTGAAVSVLPKSCANRTSDADTTINTYGNCRRVVDVGLKQDYAWTFIVADVKLWRDGPTPGVPLWGHNGRRGTPPNLTIKTQTSSSSVWSTVSNKPENSLLSCHVYLINMR